MSWRTPRRERNDRGFSLISLLIVLIILGVMMALTIDGLNGTGLPTPPTSGSTSGVTTTGGAGGIITQAAVSACEADYSSIESAIVTYFSDNGKPPGPGTTWATTNPYGAPIMQSLAHGGSELHVRLEWHRTQRRSPLRPRIDGLGWYSLTAHRLLRRLGRPD